jgi:hypothetical protein
MEEIEKRSICKNPWCKATFIYKCEEAPIHCYKCQSFDSELSDGVSWIDRQYEGDRHDGLPHPISINVQKYIDQKKSW